MDQIKIGKFIAELRKERGLTQRELADLLAISDKTVSKWERGSGLPEVSLMLPLCKELGITVNELLSGKRLEAFEYQQNAEANIMKLINEKEETKRKIILAVIVVFITLLAGISLLLVSELAELPDDWRIALVVIALVVIFGGCGVAATLEMTSGAFECAKCGERFIPTAGAYIMGMHTITRRYLKCPKCGKKSWCIRRMSITPDE
ncbi:MAG: helix-turn-helix transcriptional regulator [Clostridia bacterium]|nr:helix-turn-helix transcriptional regulator [Clostridia bacterium]